MPQANFNAKVITKSVVNDDGDIQLVFRGEPTPTIKQIGAIRLTLSESNAALIDLDTEIVFTIAIP